MSTINWKYWDKYHKQSFVIYFKTYSPIHSWYLPQTPPQNRPHTSREYPGAGHQIGPGAMKGEPAGKFTWYSPKLHALSMLCSKNKINKNCINVLAICAISTPFTYSFGPTINTLVWAG